MAVPVHGEPEPYLSLIEVYYTDGVPTSYATNGARIGGDTIDEIKMTLDFAKEALKKPIIWYGDRFPEEYNE